MTKRIFTKALLLFIFVLISFKSNATHIVGGVMNYKYLGNNNFQIDLFVYRDDLRGSPNAQLDNPAIIRIFDGNTEYRQKNFTLPFDSFLPLGQIDPCATINIVESIDWTHYKDTINLPSNNKGYIIYYQRCCRNNSILNITKDPFSNEIEWGASYSVNIPPSVNGQHVNNSSPVFINYPPVYICVNKPITYNHAATDINGDQIIYSLCTPFSGADVADPLNNGSNGQTPNDEPPPFTNVQWRSPYSISNVLGGSPLTINSSTGILSGTPNTIGQFVVGVCADEYRNGVLLTRTLRDFQFNVVDCGLQVISSFFAPTILCNNFTINFQNQSTGATTFKWYFGDGDSSTSQNPIHTYPDTGRYNVTLVCNQGQSCNSTYSQVISVQYKKIDADFIVANTSCLKQSDTIRFTDKSTDSLNVISWNWTFSNGDTSSLQNPSIIYNGSSSSVTATLFVTSVNGCTSSITKTINLYKKPTYTITGSINKCSLETSQLNVNISGNTFYSWTPTTGLNIPTISNPTTTTPVNTTYYVTIKSVDANGDTCLQKDSVKVSILNTLQIIANDSVYVCKDSVRLSVPVINGQTIIWSTTNSFSPVIGTSANITVSQTVPVQKYFVKVIVNGCEAIDSVLVFYNDSIPTVSLSSPKRFCSDSVFAYAFADYYTRVEWYNSRDLSQLVGTNLTLQITQPQGSRWYYFKAFYNRCSVTDSIELENVSLKYTKQNTAVCFGKTVTLDINVQTPLQYDIIWQVNTDTFETINISTLSVSPTVTQTVLFSIQNIFGCNAYDSIILTVNPIPVVDATIDKSVIFRGELVQLSATQNQGYQFNWTPSNLLSNPTIFNPTSTPSLNTLFKVVVTDINQCVNEDTVSVQVIDYNCNKDQIYIPNAFSPNGDGINDVFKVRSNILKSMHLEVYNRWGNKVFETDDINKSWDGSYKGQPEQEESYGYFFTGECIQGEKITYKGNITLLK